MYLKIAGQISAILKDADLATTSAKKVRQQIEEKLECDLTERRKEIDELVMECLEKKQDGKKEGGKKRSKSDDEEESEEQAVMINIQIVVLLTSTNLFC